MVSKILIIAILVVHSVAVSGKDLYCVIDDKTVLTRYSDGEPKTLKMELGCTTIKTGQQLLKVEFDPVEDKDFKSLFIKEADEITVE